MKKIERLFYLFAIFVLFVLLMYTNYKLIDYRKNFSQEMPDGLKIQSQSRLNSFYGTDDKGEKELIHFNSYSLDFFIFVSYSSDCGSCVHFLNKLHDFFLKKEIDKKIRLILITSNNSEGAVLNENFKCLKISRDDSFQFGLKIPTVFAVNGKGEILFKQTGYSDGVFDKALKTISENKYKKSRVIE